jgi:hypothetical protein
MYVERSINGKIAKLFFREPLRGIFLVAKPIVFLIQKGGKEILIL